MNVQSVSLILLAVLVVIAAGLAIYLVLHRGMSSRLKKKFGSEYDYTMEKLGDRRLVEEYLKEREKRIVSLDIHPLDDNEKSRYHREWTEIQAEFVDDPTQSVEKANRLITEVMIFRGFPVDDFEQRTEDLSVMYPNLVPHYRTANKIVMKNKDEGASTEELRQAMINYHSLFDQLLDTVHSKERGMETIQ